MANGAPNFMTNARREIRVIEEAEQDEAPSVPLPQTAQKDTPPEELLAETAVSRVDALSDQPPAPAADSNIAMPFTTDGFRDIDTESYLAESNLGVALRQARLKRKLSLEDVAAVLHIRKEYLQAIEQGNYRQLPGRTYGIGFVRTYASHLDLDPLDAIQRFKDETAEGSPDADLAFPKASTEKRLPGAAITVGSILAAGILYGAWYLYSSEDTVALEETASAESSSVKPAKPAAEPEAAAAKPAAPVAETAADTDGAAASGGDQAETSEATGSDSPATDVAPSAAAESTADIPAEQPAPVPETPAADAAAPAEQPAAAEETAPIGEQAAATAAGRVQVSVKSGSWIQIRNAEGAVVFTKLLRPGEIYSVPSDKTGFTLLTGDAGALEIRVDGNVLPTLGAPGQVRRNIPLDADKLLADAGASD